MRAPVALCGTAQNRGTPARHPPAHEPLDSEGRVPRGPNPHSVGLAELVAPRFMVALRASEIVVAFHLNLPRLRRRLQVYEARRVACPIWCPLNDSTPLHPANRRARRRNGCLVRTGSTRTGHRPPAGGPFADD